MPPLSLTLSTLCLKIFFFFLISEIDVMHLIHWCYRYRLIKTKDTRTTTAWIIGSHYLKSVQIRSFFWSEYGYMDQKKLRIWTLFTQFQNWLLVLRSSPDFLQSYLKLLITSSQTIWPMSFGWTTKHHCQNISYRMYGFSMIFKELATLRTAKHLRLL